MRQLIKSAVGDCRQCAARCSGRSEHAGAPPEAHSGCRSFHWLSSAPDVSLPCASARRSSLQLFPHPRSRQPFADLRRQYLRSGTRQPFQGGRITPTSPPVTSERGDIIARRRRSEPMKTHAPGRRRRLRAAYHSRAASDRVVGMTVADTVRPQPVQSPWSWFKFFSSGFGTLRQSRPGPARRPGSSHRLYAAGAVVAACRRQTHCSPSGDHRPPTATSLGSSVEEIQAAAYSEHCRADVVSIGSPTAICDAKSQRRLSSSIAIWY